MELKKVESKLRMVFYIAQNGCLLQKSAALHNQCSFGATDVAAVTKRTGTGQQFEQTCESLTSKM